MHLGNIILFLLLLQSMIDVFEVFLELKGLFLSVFNKLFYHLNLIVMTLLLGSVHHVSISVLFFELTKKNFLFFVLSLRQTGSIIDVLNMLVLILLHFFKLLIELIDFNLIRYDMALDVKFFVGLSNIHSEVFNEVRDLFTFFSEF